MRVLRCPLWVVAAVLLLGVTLLAGCSSDQSDPDAWLTPGPSLPARPGAHIWVVGLPDAVLASADGGSSWKVAHHGEMTNDSLGDLWGVAFGDAAHGWAVERGSVDSPTKVLATVDSGATWTWQQPGPRGKLLAVAASGARRAWAVGYQRRGTPLMLATSDGGATWRQQKVGLPPDLQLYDVAFGDARHGWVLGGNQDLASVVLATTDGGSHWRVSYKVSYRANAVQLSRLACVGPRRCWVVGHTDKPGNQQPGLVVATRDGGVHWSAQPSVTTEPLSDIAFPDARHGWAVGPSGTIIATEDGGRTWTAQHTDPRFSLKAVAFSDAAHGWAMIGNVALLATGDGGKTWTVVRPTPPKYYLAALACLGPSTVK